jgi:hypothetical protein
MLGSDLAVTINKCFGFGTLKHLSLTVSEQLVTVSTFVKVIVLFFQKKLELLHKQTTDKLIFALLEDV